MLDINITVAKYSGDIYWWWTDVMWCNQMHSRSSRIDYKELVDQLKKLEKDCKVAQQFESLKLIFDLCQASWDYLSKISKNDNSSMKQKINDYLTDVAERIHQLHKINRITQNK